MSDDEWWMVNDEFGSERNCMYSMFWSDPWDIGGAGNGIRFESALMKKIQFRYIR